MKSQNIEKEMYLSNNFLKKIYKVITFHPDYLFYKVVKVNRKYKKAKEEKNKVKMLYYAFFVNHYATKYNLELYGKFGKNLKIFHGNIIINGKAKLGNNVTLHGNNCIGNNGISEECPKIGDNVDIGWGSSLIGDVKIASNIIIGANSVVTKSFNEENIVIAGNPAKIIRRCKNDKNSSSN